MSFLAGALERVVHTEPIGLTGSVATLRGLTLLVEDCPAPTGTIVRVRSGHQSRLGEVVGFDGRHAMVMMFGATTGIRAGDRVTTVESSPTVPVGRSLLGRVLNGLGQPIDGKGALRDTHPQLLHPAPIAPLRRRPITRALPTGVRAVDLLTTVGRGQRMGIFAGPGVGKSVLLGMIARQTAADVNVIAMIGERGREVREFIEHTLGPEGLARSVVVVATSDDSALLRVRAAMVACAVAESFRDAGSDVMLIMDSVTRLAHAQRQIGLAVGEPPATRGYTPSVFALLPQVLERAGSVEVEGDGGGGASGSITGFYTVLVEGDDMTEPVADAVRGILDGHLILSRKLANRGHYPAVDPLDSVSRLATAVMTPEHQAARRQVLRLLAAHRDVEELVQIGAYAAGSNPSADAAIRLMPRMEQLLCQQISEAEGFEAARERLMALAKEAEAPVDARRGSGGQGRPAPPAQPAPPARRQ